MGHPEASFRVLAAEVVCLAIAAQPRGDTLAVGVAVDRAMRGRSADDRLKFEAILAWTAAGMALQLPADVRERYLASMRESTAELQRRLCEELLG